MPNAADYLGDAAKALLEADDQWRAGAEQGSMLTALTALTMAVMSIAVELGVPPPEVPDPPPAQADGQQKFTY